MRISDWSSDVCSSDLVGEVRLLFPVILQRVVQHRLGLVELLIRGDQAFGNDEPGAVRTDREAHGLELGERFAAPLQRLGVVSLRRRHLADAIFAVGNEDRIAGPRAGFDLAMPPGLRLAEVLRSEEHPSELQSPMRTSYAV